MKIAHFGTFDVENYGDLLFPLVLERRLGHLCEEIVHVSPLGGPAVWRGCRPTIQAADVLRRRPEVDAVLLGGGHLLHSSRSGVEAYETGDGFPLVAYPSLWLGSAQWAATHGLPLAWNAPGAPRPFTAASAPLVGWAASVSRYVSVRDRFSAELLRSAGASSTVSVVPDTGLDVAALWTEATLRDAYERAFAARGRDVPDRTLCLHFNSRYVDEPISALAERVDRMAALAQATPVLLALGPCHGDGSIAEEIGGRARSRPLLVERPRSLVEAVALLACSDAYIGSSLHGFITASAFGRRGAIVASEVATGFRKFTGLLEQHGLTEWLLPSWAVAEETLDELLTADGDAWARVPRTAAPLLDAHWARLEAALGGIDERRRPVRGALTRLDELVAGRSGRPPIYQPLVLEELERIDRRADEGRARARDALSERDRALSGRADVEDTLREREDELEAVRAAREEAERKVGEREEDLRAAEVGRQESRNALREQEEALRAAEATREALEERIATHKRALERRVRQVEEASESRERLERELAAHRIDAEAAADERGRLEAELSTQLEEARYAAAEASSLHARLEQIDRSFAEQLEENERALATAKAEISRLQDARKTAVAAELAATRQTREAERARSSLDAELADRTRALERLRVRFQRVSIAGRRSQEDAHARGLALQRALRARDAAVAALRSREQYLSYTSKRLDHAARDLEGLRAQLTEAERMALEERAARERATLSAASERDKREQGARETARRLLERRLSGAETSARSRFDEAERLRAELKAVGREAETESAELSGVIEELQRALGDTRADIERVSRSRSWRWGHRLVRLLSTLALRRSVRPEGAVEAALERLDALDPQVRTRRPGRTVLRSAVEGGRRRPKVAVICWDMGHNPLGRAHLIAGVLARSFEVELVGAQFPRFGTSIWAPVRDSSIPMRAFEGASFPGHLARMDEIAASIDADAVYVSKPRLPSYELGMLAKAQRACPLLLDVDDRELAFFGATTAIDLDEAAARAGDPDFAIPFGETWTRVFDGLIPCADHLTVSNAALQSCYGGELFPHVRDERVFDPSLYDRDAVRAKLGFGPEDRVVLFIGTPREHKGLFEIAEALERIGDPRNKLCVVGSAPDKSVRKRLEALPRERVRLLPDQPYAELPRNLAVGDLICLFQDPRSEIARYQMPAKFTDGLAMGVPMIARRVPPLEAAAADGLVELVDGAPLHERIAEALDDRDARRERALAARERFLEEYSYAAMAPRLKRTVERLLESPSPLASPVKRVIAFQREAFDARLSGELTRPEGGAPRARVESTAVSATSNGRGAGPPTTPPNSARRRGRALTTRPPLDIVFFWKQNDTGVYGRRSDMIMKYLARSDDVRRIVHFDTPVDGEALYQTLREDEEMAHQAKLIARRTLRRAAGREHHGKLRSYAFVHRPESDGLPRRIRRLPLRSEYMEWLASVLDDNGVGLTARTVLWVCPRNFDFPTIAETLRHDLVVADVIDDHRAWVDPSSSYHRKLTQNYEEILGLSDLVLANTESVGRSMSEYIDGEIHVVPNACEPPAEMSRAVIKPRELRRMKGPILGYVGNLSSRIDTSLLDHVANARPGWNLVLIGSAHLSRAVIALDRHPNVHFLGVKPYEEAQRYVRHFDVGIVPHLDNELTRSMHPLKVFVYCSAGVPVVSTDIANLPELAELVDVAGTPGEFVAKVESALRAGKRALSERDRNVLERESWPVRIDTILPMIHAWLDDADSGQLRAREGSASRTR